MINKINKIIFLYLIIEKNDITKKEIQKDINLNDPTIKKQKK